MQVLADQQAGSGYPTRWPLPFPVEQFLVRAGELDAWVAVDGGEVVGHVSVLRPRAGWESDGWAAGTGLAPGLLAAVGVLFVDPAVAARGPARRLPAPASLRRRARALAGHAQRLARHGRARPGLSGAHVAAAPVEHRRVRR